MDNLHTENAIQGLSAEKVAELTKRNGLNEIPEKQENITKKIVKNLLSPIALMLILASLCSFILGKTFDGYFILILLVLNIAITLWQERKADDAIRRLNEHLAQQTKTLRDGAWQRIDARNLVVGDVIQLAAGEVIPADGIILAVTHASFNEAALTGESLPKRKQEGDTVYSGSFLVTGMVNVRVMATGGQTSFGKTVFSVERLRKQSLLEKDIAAIAQFLTILSLVAIGLLTFLFFWQRVSIVALLTLDLSLLIAGIPISLPTVMTLIIEFGVIALAKKNAIVRRLSSLEDLANVNYVLTDKTGTLTENQVTVQDIYAYGSFTHHEVILYALLATAQNDHDEIDLAIAAKAKEMQIDTSPYIIADFIPADSGRKRSTTIIHHGEKLFVVSIGAPQIIRKLCKSDPKTVETFEREVAMLAANGFRSLAVAITMDGKTERDMHLVGILALSDTLRDDAKGVIQFLKENNIGVSLVTGDNRAIASHIAKALSLDDGEVITKSELDRLDWQQIREDFYYRTGAFAEILPADKLKLVEKAKAFFVVAANGDGVNDLPALKAANVGIAVKNAVAALKATADIVLLSDGIGIIRDAILESRKIFQRLYTYSLYRISESLRLIVTIAVLGILYKVYPLTALQIIVIALLNDIPIISLASDRVKIPRRPAKINARKRFLLSSLYGLTGIANSLILFVLVRNIMHLDWNTIQTVYFLKLTVSGHMLIYVAHTRDRWWKFLPSKGVIWATTLTQLLATLLAFTGFLMPAHISLFWILLVWVWSFFWMQVGEMVKIVQQHLLANGHDQS